MTDTRGKLEASADQIIAAFGIKAPPVPIELMLQKPVNDMWEEVDLMQLSGTFMSMRDRYSPRMSLARLLARHIAGSSWGQERSLLEALEDQEGVAAFARMLIMPRSLMQNYTSGDLNPTLVSFQFEVPEEDARLRLQEIL